MTAMRLATICLIALLPVASAISCRSTTAPACEATCDGDLVVFGQATVWTGMAVPGATVTVQLIADTTQVYGNCTGTSALAVASQPLDAAGNYRLPIVAAGAAGRSVCVEVTADPHGWASDVGIKHVSGGVVQLHSAPAGGQPDSIRVDMHYSELP